MYIDSCLNGLTSVHIFKITRKIEHQFSTIESKLVHTNARLIRVQYIVCFCLLSFHFSVFAMQTQLSLIFELLKQNLN